MRPNHLSPPHNTLPQQKAADVLLDAEQLGRFFNLGTARDGTARAALNMRISRGHPMPPCIDIPGMAGRRWLLSSVIQWLQTYLPIPPMSVQDSAASRSKRGRDWKYCG